MGSRCQARYRKRVKTRGPRKPGYAEIVLCSAQVSPKGPHGGVVWQPVSGFLEQVKRHAAEHGITLGRYMERYTEHAIYAFKNRGLVLVNYRTNTMRMTAKGNKLIREVFTDIDESGETFATDLERLYAACTLFKKRLRPLNKHTKMELISKLEILLGNPRLPDEGDLDAESDGTDVDSIMEDIDDAIIVEASLVPEPIINPATPSRCASNQSCHTPNLVYPSPVSAPRPQLGPQGSLYYTPPPSPTWNPGHSNDILMEDENEHLMDIDEIPSLDPGLNESSQQIIKDLKQTIQKLKTELDITNASKQKLEETITILEAQVLEPEPVITILQTQIHELQTRKDEVEVENQQLRAQITKFQEKLERVMGICQEL